MTGRTDSHSRHLYDIYRLMECIKVDNELKALAETVRLDRQADSQCPSAKENVDLNSVLKEILKKVLLAFPFVRKRKELAVQVKLCKLDKFKIHK